MILADDLQATLGQDLVGAYTFGSAVSGGFDPALSDLDLVIVTEGEVDQIDFGKFAGIVGRLAAREPDWAGRLDLTFVGRRTLAAFRSGGPFVEVSHETPLRLYREANDWLETWFLAGDADRPIVGPPASELFPPISFDEFLATVVDGLDEFVGAIQDDTRHEIVAYRVLTPCRILRSLETGRLSSKRDAAEWAAACYPTWSELLRAAWQVRVGRDARPFTPSERSEISRLLTFLVAEAKRVAARRE